LCDVAPEERDKYRKNEKRDGFAFRVFESEERSESRTGIWHF